MQRFIPRALSDIKSGSVDFLSRLLYARGFKTVQDAETFLHPSLENLHDPFYLHDMREVVRIINLLGRRKARAVVYGDYDVDGICASVIAKEALEAAGLQCIVYIPDRHQEGYGINREAVHKLSSQAELLLTVDCGISAVDEVKLAKELGMTVIITDHHQPSLVLPAADAVINPLLSDYPFPSLCGAGTAWKLSWALHGLQFAQGQLDLAALATIADMVPLLHENRIIASFGLEAIASSVRPGIISLMKAAGLPPGKKVTSEKVAFALAPRLNAGGRMSTAQDALLLMQTNSPQIAADLAQRLNMINTSRQQEERLVIQACRKELEDRDMLHRHTIVLCREGWNKGLVGLAAGKLAESFGLPCLVLSKEGQQATGSGRTAGCVDLFAALDSCRDLFLRFGGHRAAAGLTIEIINIRELEERFEEAVKSQLKGAPLISEITYDTELSLSEITVDTIRQIELLEPFGMGNPSPGFLLRNAELLHARAVGAEDKHLKLSLKMGRDISEGIGFGFGEKLNSLPPSMNAVVKLSLNEFRNRISAQFQLQALQAGNEAFKQDAGAERRILLNAIDGMIQNQHLPPVSISSFDFIRGSQGSLLFCRSAETGNRLHALYPEFSTAANFHRDQRGGNTILCHIALEQIKAPCEFFYFCDGLISPLEAAYAHHLFPEAEIYAAEQTPQLLALIGSLRLSIEELREIYIKLRQGQCIIQVCPDPERGMAAAMILEEIGLAAREGQYLRLLPPKKADPRDSLVFKLLN